MLNLIGYSTALNQNGNFMLIENKLVYHTSNLLYDMKLLWTGHKCSYRWMSWRPPLLLNTSHYPACCYRMGIVLWGLCGVEVVGVYLPSCFTTAAFCSRTAAICMDAVLLLFPCQNMQRRLKRMLKYMNFTIDVLYHGSRCVLFVLVQDKLIGLLVVDRICLHIMLPCQLTGWEPNCCKTKPTNQSLLQTPQPRQALYSYSND